MIILMKEFNKFRVECNYRDNKNCTYWSKPTQCHFLACPFFSREYSEKSKQILKKKMKESVLFTVDDFDAIKTTSVQDIISEIRKKEIIYPNGNKGKIKESIHIEKPIERMKCIVCGELIDDDKFTTFHDVKGVLIYIHSKGKCKIRWDQVPEIRERWLKHYTSEGGITEDGEN